MEIEKKIVLSEEEYNQLTKDRLDFGFDSIYFRYARTIDELVAYKEQESCRLQDNKDFGYWKRWGNQQKAHFYMTLEQLVHAHEVKK